MNIVENVANKLLLSPKNASHTDNKEVDQKVQFILTKYLCLGYDLTLGICH